MHPNFFTTSLDKSLCTQLDQFLYEKEGFLGESIVQSIHIVGEAQQLPAKDFIRLKLSEALEIFEKRIRELPLSDQPKPSMKDFDFTISLMNNSLWQYVSTLEGCVTELFQHLNRIGLEKWHKEMSAVVNSIKVMLMHRMEDVSWAIPRMETLLWKYRNICAEKEGCLSALKRWFPWSHLLDRALLINLDKSKKYLGFCHKKFTDRMLDYNQFHQKIDHSFNKFQGFRVFNAMDSFDQENFKRIYQLLKLWELNQASKSLPSQDIVHALRHVQIEEKVYQVFKDYYQALRNNLFHQARLFKLGPQDLWRDGTGKTLALEVISGNRAEIRTLGSTILKYRDFLLRTDPNPYVRSRWGFAEWVVGPEPSQSKRLLKLTYEIEALESLYEKLRESLEKGPHGTSKEQLSQSAQQIDRWLHEMSQPLTSRAIMHANAERVINKLSELDELGSFNRGVMEFVGQILSKILRADWKYHVVFDNPKFVGVYEIHMGLIGRIEDRQHLNRLNKFKHMIQQIEDWSKQKMTQRHVHEIEQDLSDIKTLLQDFLAFVQRLASQPDIDQGKLQELRAEISRQLLEYRYLFGKFFHVLSQNESDEHSLRSQFLFVYQYFEAIENKLNA